MDDRSRFKAYKLSGMTARVRLEAAKLVAELDRQQGKRSPQWLLDILNRTSPDKECPLAEQRARADFELSGDTPESRRLSAEILVKVDRLEGIEPEPWVLAVAEGRLDP